LEVNRGFYRLTFQGTKLFEPLQSVLEERSSSFGAVRNIIIVSDGEVSDKIGVFNLAKKYSSNSKYYAIGIGSDVDKDMINTIAKVQHYGVTSKCFR
jgi:hypothetical protein